MQLEINTYILCFTMLSLKNFVFKTQAIKKSLISLSVPYPYAVGEKYVYFMLHNVLQPVEDFDLKKDAYMQYYGWHIKPEEQKI